MMPVLSGKVFALAMLMVMAIAMHATALINPSFTPVHLTQQANQILVVEGAGEVTDRTIRLAVARTVKGEKGSILNLSVTDMDENAGDELLEMLTATDSLALFFRADSAANLHTQGRWFVLKAGADGATWSVQGEDDAFSGLLATWRGGTDMLLRCIEAIMAHPGDIHIVSSTGTSVSGMASVDGGPAEVTGITLLELDGGASSALHIAGPQGDVLVAGTPGALAIDNITEDLGISARSLASTWGDFDGNGRLDLASWDGTQLTIWSRGDDNTFTARPGVALPASTHTLLTMSDGQGPAALIAAGAYGVHCHAHPLDPQSAPVTVIAAGAAADTLGRIGQALLADLTGNGHPDLLQLYERQSLLYEGTGHLQFSEPVGNAVASGAGPGRLHVADFDGDGTLDLLLSSNVGVRLYRNKGGGIFQETKEFSGELSYKDKNFASWAVAGDLNNNGRDDLLITYWDEGPGLFFNRGFSSFGHASDLTLELDELPQLDSATGQAAVFLADMNRNGAQDLLFVCKEGTITCVYNQLGEEAPLHVLVRIAPDAAGPVTVHLRNEIRSLGVRVLQPGHAATFFGVPEPGLCTLYWQFPGSEVESRSLIVIDSPVTVTLGGEQ